MVGLRALGRALELVQAVDRQLRRGERLEELVEDGCGEGAQRVPAVEQEGLSPTSGFGGVESGCLAIRRGDGESVEADPPACLAVRRVPGVDDGELLEMASELLFVQAAEDDGAYIFIWLEPPNRSLVLQRVFEVHLPFSASIPSKPFRSMAKARLLMSPWVTMESSTKGYSLCQPSMEGPAPNMPTFIKLESYATPKICCETWTALRENPLVSSFVPRITHGRIFRTSP